MKPANQTSQGGFNQATIPARPGLIQPQGKACRREASNSPEKASLRAKNRSDSSRIRSAGSKIQRKRPQIQSSVPFQSGSVPLQASSVPPKAGPGSPKPGQGRFSQTIKPWLLLALLCLLPTLATAATENATALINRAMSADYDEAGALAIQAQAANFDQATRTLIKGITLHNLSWCGQERFTQEAIDTLALVKGDPLGQIYWGSAITLIAQYAIKRKDVGIAAAKAQEGLAIIAAAFKLAPDSFHCNYLRLLNGIEISRQSPFKQYDTIKANVDFLVAALAKPNELDKSLKAAVWLSVGDWWFDTRQASKALAYYQKAIREAPASRAGKQASQYLADLEG